jgi:class 3 adenylate cyclase
MEQLQTLTVLKTDIRRFTDRVEQMSPRELDVFLREHRALVGGLLRQRGGTVIKEIGDSFLAVFNSSTQALRAAVALQRELSVTEAGKSKEKAIELRIAVAAGDVLLQDGDVFGTPVNTVARLEALTPPGEIYFTEAVWLNVVRGEIAADFVDTFHLKGITEPVRAYRTTFRHQTRLLTNMVLLVTDLIDFTAWAEQAELATVESQLELWGDAHQLAAGGNGGVIRLVMGDSLLMTFDDVGRAIAAWKDLNARVDAYNDDPSCPRPIRFSTGLGQGDVRVFRSAIYGNAVNFAFQAAMWSREVSPRCLGIPAGVATLLQREPAALDGLELRCSADRATLHEVPSTRGRSARQ